MKTKLLRRLRKERLQNAPARNYRHLQNMLDGAMTKPAGASKQKR